MLDLFQLLSSPDVNWWTGVVWIIVMFLSAVWTLILTAPIHYRASIAETLIQRHISINLMKQTHPNLGWPEGKFYFYFWVNYSSKTNRNRLQRTLLEGFCALLWCVHWSLAGDDDRPIIFQNLLKCCLYRGTEHIVLESAVLSGVSGMQPGDSFTFLRQPTSSFEGWPIMSVTCLVAFCSLSVPRRWWKILPNMNTFKRVFPSLFSSVFTVFTHQTRRLSVSNPLYRLVLQQISSN